MFSTASKTDRAKGAVATGAATVSEGAQAAAAKTSDKASDLKVKAGEAAAATAASAAVAREKATEAAEYAQEAAETVREYAHEAAETLAPKVEHARETFIEDVLPKVVSAMAAIAAGAAAAKESAVEAADRAPDAYAVLKGDAVAKKGGKGKWILLLGALAAGAAVMAWRKSNERPDPWATAGSYTPPKSASEKFGEFAGAAKDKATEVKDAAVDKAGELKDKATDAKDAAVDKAEQVKESAADTIDDAEDTFSEGTDATETAEGDEASALWTDAGAGDDSIASTSGTSEGSDLSTPHLDTESTDKA